MSGQIVSCGSCREEDFSLGRKDFSFDEKMNDHKIEGRRFPLCFSDIIAWNSLENLRNSRAFLKNNTWDTKTIRILSLRSHPKFSDTEITARNNYPIHPQSFCSGNSERDRSQATIADILEHCGNGDWGTAIRDSWASEELHEVLNEISESIELGVEAVTSAVAEVISAVGEIDPP